jgi:choline dehydrogenase-like flavoprotein
MDARFEGTPISFALGGLPLDGPRWGREFKTMLQEVYSRTMEIASHSTSLPVETNTISLDPEVQDAWGLPALRMTYRDHPDDLKTMQFFQDRAMELLEAAGAQQKWVSYPVHEQDFAFHLLGTCRMGGDPKTSVVNKYHRAHDVPNLFICDGSSFVTSGRGQPTCTIQALAFRAADHIIRSAKSGQIKSSA